MFLLKSKRVFILFSLGWFIKMYCGSSESDRKLSLKTFILKVPTGCTRFHASEPQSDLLSSVLCWFILIFIYPAHIKEGSDINLDNVSLKVFYFCPYVWWGYLHLRTAGDWSFSSVKPNSVYKFVKCCCKRGKPKIKPLMVMLMIFSDMFNENLDFGVCVIHQPRLL